VPDVL
jgi:hypothetical protein